MAIGFVGALVIIRPGFGDTPWQIVFTLGSAVSSAFYALLTRKLSAGEDAATSATIATVVGTVALSLVVWSDWRAPSGAVEIAMIASLGLLSGLGHYLYTVALGCGPASVIAPFNYSHLIFAALLGLRRLRLFPGPMDLGRSRPDCGVRPLYRLSRDGAGQTRGRPETVTRDALVVAFDANERDRGIVAEAWGEAGPLLYLAEAPSPEARAVMLQRAAALLARHTGNDFRREEWPLLAGARLLQMLPAGVDFMPLRDLPPELPVAGNGGASAEPMAEHGAALALAAAKRLFIEHAELRAGRFNQFEPNIRLAGGVCGIFGFGGIGAAVARPMRAFGMSIHAINRRGGERRAGGLDRRRRTGWGRCWRPPTSCSSPRRSAPRPKGSSTRTRSGA